MRQQQASRGCIHQLAFFSLLLFRLLSEPGLTVSSVPRMTVIPPGPVTDKIKVEIRLAVPNNTPRTQKFHISFYWDRVAPNHLIERRLVSASPGKFAFARVWWDTTGHVGKRKLIFRAKSRNGTLQGTWPLEVVPCKTRALPLLQGGWLDPLGLSNGVYPRDRPADEQYVRAMIDAMRRLRMTVAVVTYVEYGYFFYPSKVRFYDQSIKKIVKNQLFDFDVVEAILSQADRNGIHVFLGLGRSGDINLLGEFDKPDWKVRNRQAIEVAQHIARELWERYSHHPSFYGWYLTHEMNDLRRASAYYAPVADFCHILSPDKPVMIAPAGTPVIDKETLSRSHIDIFCYQDAVGAGYIPYEYTYKPEKRLATLDQIYRDYAKLHQDTGKHLWSDLEIWEMDGTVGYASAYPAPFSRVQQQIVVECKYVDILTAYEVFGFLQPPNIGVRLSDRRAADLYSEYDSYLRKEHHP